MNIPPPILATENVICDIMNMSIMDPDDEGGDMTLQLTSKMSSDGTEFGKIWFDNSEYKRVSTWLSLLIKSDLFKKVMIKPKLS